MNGGLDFYQTKYELRLAWDVKCLLRMSSGLDMSASLDFYQTKYELRLGYECGIGFLFEQPSQSEELNHPDIQVE